MRTFLTAVLCLASLDVHARFAVLQWQPPTENTDGTPLTDLAGYRIAWSCASSNPDNFENEIVLLWPNLTQHVVRGLPATGTCWFAVRALNAGRSEVANVPSRTSIESAPSNVAAKAMTGATEPAAPYTREVAVAEGAEPLEVLPPARYVIGYTGEPIAFPIDSVGDPAPTLVEFEFEDVQSGAVTPATMLLDDAADVYQWTPPRAGLWVVRQRSCNITDCGAWRSSLEDGFAFWIQLSAPTDGGFD